MTGPLSSNHGEIVHQWCLDGQGISLRSWWDVRDNIASGHGASAAGILSTGQYLGGVCVAAGDLGENPGHGRVLRHYFQQHYPQQCIVSRET